MAEEIPAYKIWLTGYQSKHLDAQIKFVLNGKIEACSGGRLSATRKALLISSNEIARRLGITTSSFGRLEKNDLKGNIRLSSLAKAADAMNCELLYFLRPKSGISYSHEIWSILLPRASQNGMYNAATGERKQRALYGAAKRVLANPAVARAQGWSARRMKMFYERE